MEPLVSCKGNWGNLEYNNRTISLSECSADFLNKSENRSVRDRQHTISFGDFRITKLPLNLISKQIRKQLCIISQILSLDSRTPAGLRTSIRKTLTNVRFTSRVNIDNFLGFYVPVKFSLEPPHLCLCQFLQNEHELQHQLCFQQQPLLIHDWRLKGKES